MWVLEERIASAARERRALKLEVKAGFRGEAASEVGPGGMKRHEARGRREGGGTI